jgi:hypothetical protein
MFGYGLNHFEGGFIDAKDSLQVWCIARVTKFHPLTGLIDISFCGKSYHHDEANINPSGGRIAAFRSMSRGNSQI